MSPVHLARRSAAALIVAIAAFAARPAQAQSPLPATAPAAVDSIVAAHAGQQIDTVHVKVKKRRWWQRERDLIVGNRFLAKEIKRYDKRIVELEQRLDSLRLAAAQKWKEAREMEEAFAQARARRIEVERRIAMLTADTTASARGIVAAPK